MAYIEDQRGAKPNKMNDNWPLQHLRWLAELVLPHQCQQIVLQEADDYYRTT